MNFLYLRAYHAVASERSFTRAAQILKVSQSTLSCHVKALEESYGIRLLDRRGRTVVPTDIGEALLAQCRELFRHEEQIDDLLNQGQRLQAGRLRIGADGPRHVVPVLRKFMELHPDFQVAMSGGNSRKVTHDLLNYETDVAIVATPSGTHLDHVTACATRKIHTLCEKPIEITTARIAQMIDVALGGHDEVGRPGPDGVEDALVMRCLETHARVDDDPSVVGEEHVGRRAAAGAVDALGDGLGRVVVDRPEELLAGTCVDEKIHLIGRAHVTSIRTGKRSR